MIYCFDLDGTLVSSSEGVYGDAIPIPARIQRLHELRREGHTIVIATARGAMWEDFTRAQLARLEIPYDVLSVGAKPWAHYYIDDKAINAEDFFG